MKRKYNSPRRDVKDRLDHVEMAIMGGECRAAGVLLVAAAIEAGQKSCGRKKNPPHLTRIIKLQDQLVTSCVRRRFNDE